MKTNEDGITTRTEDWIASREEDGLSGSDVGIAKTNGGGRRRETGGCEPVGSRERCERVLEIIRERARPLPLSELAERITGRRGSEGTPHRDVDDEYRLQLHLHHVVLPKLQARGEIVYDPSRRLVL